MSRNYLLAAATALALSAAPAHAATPPTMLSAGIDANDRLYATWTLAAGTIFSHVTFATDPTPDADLAEFFRIENFADFECGPPPAVCTAPLTTTSYTGSYAVPRDRRYFVKVVATDAANTGGVSDIWVIDEAKPLIAGAVEPFLGPPTNTPVAGRPFSAATPPPGTTPPGTTPPPTAPPAPAISIVNPRTIGTVLTRGVRVRVRCLVTSCSAIASVKLGPITLSRKTGTIPAGSTRTLVLRPTTPANRRRLSRRASARLVVSASARRGSGAATRSSRTFLVRR